MNGDVVILCDRPWVDVSLERRPVERSGARLVTGGTQAGSPESIETLVAPNDPVAILSCWLHNFERRARYNQPLRTGEDVAIAFAGFTVARPLALTAG